MADSYNNFYIPESSDLPSLLALVTGFSKLKGIEL
jgi:hypothetical protein